MATTKRRNAPARSERAAWKEVHDISIDIRRIATGPARLIDAGKIAHYARELQALADRMTDQLADGIHANPPLTVFSLANPPRRGGQLMSRRLYTIEYKHAGNGKDYYHDFKPGTQMIAEPDGSIVIRRPGSRVWVDLP